MSAPAGWYPAGGDATQERYWTGETWSDQHRPLASAASPASVPVYGAAIVQPAMLAVVPVGPPNGVALAGFLCSLISAVLLVCFFWTVVATFLLGAVMILGFILSIAGIRKANRYVAQGLPPTRRGLAVAGAIISGIFIAIDVLTIVLILSLGAALLGGAAILSTSG